MAPTPLPARTRPYQYSPTPFMRRSPKASMKVMKPVQPAHDAHGGQPQHHLGVGDRLQPDQVLLACLRLPGLAVLAHPGRARRSTDRSAARPESTGSRAPATAAADEHDRGQDEHGRRAAELVEDHRRDRHDETGQRAEQRQPGVERA